MSNLNTYSETDSINNELIDESESTIIIVFSLISFLILFIGVLVYYLPTKPPVATHHINTLPVFEVEPHVNNKNISNSYD